MGVLVFLVALLPLSGGNNLHLMRAESTGPSVSKLVPRVKTTAKILYGIYISLTLLEIMFLLFGGASFFEAATLSFGTVGTGGFGILNSSAADYSPYIQNVITIFMIISGIDFSFYYLLIMRKFKSALKMEEVRGYFIIILTAVILISINIFNYYNNIFDTLRHSAFQVSSIITTTGFSSVDFDKWPEFSKIILIGLMFCGACAGSTGGGMKVSRIIVLFKTIVKEIKVLAHPKSAVKVKFNGRVLEHETLRAINVYFVAYFMIFAVSLLIISIDNFDFTTNFTAVTATISNIGPGLSAVGPTCNFSEYSNISKLILTAVMIAGRLEPFPILVLLSKNTWKK
jgi:trk system potassium uptake protein TrkH